MAAHVTSQAGRNRWPYYRCSTFSNRGNTDCSNNLRIPMEAADCAVLDLFEAVVLDVDVIETAILRAIGRLRSGDDQHEPRRATILADLARIADEQQRYADAIATAGNLEVLATAPRERDHQRARLEQELVTLQQHVSTFQPRQSCSALSEAVSLNGVHCFADTRQSQGRCYRGSWKGD